MKVVSPSQAGGESGGWESLRKVIKYILKQKISVLYGGKGYVFF